MKKRIVSIAAAASMLLSMFSAVPAAAASGSGTASDYLRDGDYCVISPAEKWDKNGNRIAVATTEWELTAQSSGTANGNDVQTWKYGVSDKFYVSGAGNGTFRLQCKNFRESGGGRYWDIEDRNKKPGANVHVWSYKDSDSQKFYLEEDNDGDPETFYIKNKNSGIYLAPENYFKDPGSNSGMKKNSWSEEGCNTIQSKYPFHWRIQVLNRDAANDAGGYDKYANWMSLLPDDRYLSEINIPGTHDSGTTNVEGSWNSGYNVVACQKYFIEQQLYAGIRSLDIRTAWNNDSKDMVLIHGNKSTVCHTPDHGDSSENKRFSSVVDTMIKFLGKHPDETIVMTLKIDDGDSAETRQRLGNILLRYINDSTKSKYFYKWSDKDSASDARKDMKSPTLGQVRGKIVILSRVDFNISDLGIDNAQKGLLCCYTGPDISNWDDRYNDNDHYAQKITDKDSGVAVYIQDDYSSPDGNKKTQLMNTIDQLNGDLKTLNGKTVPSIDKKDFTFNYSSKTTSDSLGASPLGGAKYMNNIIYNDSKFTPSVAKGAVQSMRTGIVVMDYINKQLARRIIDLNYLPASISESPNKPGTTEQPSPAVQFKDVSDVDWFFNDVSYVKEKGLMNGTGDQVFSPYDTSTRAMIVTVLYRMEGSPEVSGRTGFKDVKEGSYYEKAVKWAAENNIVNGYSDEIFGCDDDITREQMAALLYRYASYKGISGSALSEDINRFNDSADISAYAVPAMQWAAANGIITDIGNGTLDPRGEALRSQIAAILHRFHENMITK